MLLYAIFNKMFSSFLSFSFLYSTLIMMMFRGVYICLRVDTDMWERKCKRIDEHNCEIIKVFLTARGRCNNDKTLVKSSEIDIINCNTIYV